MVVPTKNDFNYKRDLLVRIEKATQLIEPGWLITSQTSETKEDLKSIMNKMTNIKMHLLQEEKLKDIKSRRESR